MALKYPEELFLPQDSPTPLLPETGEHVWRGLTDFFRDEREHTICTRNTKGLAAAQEEQKEQIADIGERSTWDHMFETALLFESDCEKFIREARSAFRAFINPIEVKRAVGHERITPEELQRRQLTRLKEMKIHYSSVLEEVTRFATEDYTEMDPETEVIAADEVRDDLEGYHVFAESCPEAKILLKEIETILLQFDALEMNSSMQE